MRFQQLKRNPNTIVKKKLVKSKKNWIVVSSLSLAGGLLLLGGTGVNVDAATTEAPSTVSSSSIPASSKQSSTPSTGTTTDAPSAVSSSSILASSKQSSISSAKTTTTSDQSAAETTDSSADTSISKTDTAVTTKDITVTTTPDTVTSETEKAPIVSTTDMDNVATKMTADVTTPVVPAQTVSDGTDTTVSSDITDATSSTTDVANNSATTDVKDLSTDLKANAIVAPVATVIASTQNSGTNGTSNWDFTESTGNLHIGAGTLAPSTGKTSSDLWGGHTDDVATITIDPTVVADADSSNLFSNMTNLTSVTGLSNLDTSNTTNMSSMFENDSKLTDVNLSGNNVSNVTDMSKMFKNDTSLVTTEYPDSANQGNNVTALINSDEQYSGDTVLTTPNISKWQVHHLKSSISMFKNDIALKSLDLTGWITAYTSTDTGDSTKGEGMFDGTSLTTITLNNDAYFNPKTALTSNDGSTWTGGTTSFSGIPTTGTGLGSIYTGWSSKVKSTNGVSNTYTATPSPDGTAVSNLITVSTNHGNITVQATGNVGQNSSFDLPQTITVDGHKYTTTTATDTATFGQTMANADNVITYDAIAVKGGSLTIPTSTGSSITVTVPDGTDGESTTVEIPANQIPKGYHVVPKQVTVTYDAEGTIQYSTDTSELEVVGNTVTNNSYSVPTTTTGKTVSVTFSADSKVGDKGVIATLPDTTGYTAEDISGHEVTTVKGSIDENGNFIPDETITYVGKPASSDAYSVPTTTTGKTVTATIPAGSKVGDTEVTATLPTETGYTAENTSGHEVTTVTGSIDESGNFIPDTPVTYVGNLVENGTYDITNSSTGKTVTVAIPAGSKVGDTVTIPLDTVDGYTAKNAQGDTITSITGTIDSSGKFVSSNSVKYVGNHLDNIKVAANQLDSNNNSADISQTIDSTSNSNAIVGDAVTVDAPKITGYVPNSPTVTGTLQSDGSLQITTPLTYTPVKSEAVTLNVKNPDGTTSTLTIPAGGYDETVSGSKTAEPATIKGYQAPSVSYKYGADGKIILKDSQGNTVQSTDTLTYTAGTDPATTVSVPSNKDSVAISVPAGTVGTSAEITVNTPDGYTTPNVKVDYTPDGVVIKDLSGNVINESNPIIYTGIDNPATTVSVKNPDGTISEISIPEGHFGDNPVTIKAENKSGYTAPSINVTYGANGVPTVTDSKGQLVTADTPLTYVKISSGGSSNNIHINGNGDIENQHIYVATYADQPSVELYALTDTNTMIKMDNINNRDLGQDTGWYSDEKVVVDGITYYRVATNEWAKASQVYEYEPMEMDIRTYNDTDKSLYKAEGNLVKDRLLAPNTDWYSDRIAYIDGAKYYRVATNEFVNVDDAYPLNGQAVPDEKISSTSSLTVQHAINYIATPSTQTVQAYSVTNNNQITSIPNRQLEIGKTFFSDQVITIAGTSYYRVATNEFVKANDVDVNK